MTQPTVSKHWRKKWS